MGLCLNISQFKHLLAKVDFDFKVDHLALIYIIKSNQKNKNSKLLEVLSAYLFNLYYMKGREMKLSDFLSRTKVSKSNPYEIIPISVTFQEVLQEKYYILTRSGA